MWLRESPEIDWGECSPTTSFLLRDELGVLHETNVSCVPSLRPSMSLLSRSMREEAARAASRQSWKWNQLQTQGIGWCGDQLIEEAAGKATTRGRGEVYQALLKSDQRSPR